MERELRGLEQKLEDQEKKWNPLFGGFAFRLWECVFDWTSNLWRFPFFLIFKEPFQGKQYSRIRTTPDSEQLFSRFWTQET